MIFGGRIVEELVGAEADEARLLRAAYHLRSGALMPEEAAGAAVVSATADIREAGATTDEAEIQP